MKTIPLQKKKKSGIIDFLNSLSRYSGGRKLKNINRKLMKIGLEKVAKMGNISKNELNQSEKLQKKSIDELRKIASISSIIFWDFSMFYQIFLSPQVKRWANITYKHGIYELSHELPNDLRLRYYEIRKH